jgi:hypothetical protein
MDNLDPEPETGFPQTLETPKKFSVGKTTGF